MNTLQLRELHINKNDIQHQAEELKNFLIIEYKLEPIKIKVKDIRRGRAIYSSRFISIPLWAYNIGISYFYWYIIHEVSHFICNDKLNYHGHGKTFKIIETKILKTWGLNPIYSKAYVKELRANNGAVLYKREV
jgi:hypothetical protein